MSVTGTIGNDQVFLDNAATESTLQKLLAAIEKLNGTVAAQKVAGTAKAAGIDPKIVDEANNKLGTIGKTATGATKSLDNFTTTTDTATNGLSKMANASASALGSLYAQLMSGQPSISGTLAAFEELPGPLGAVAKLFGAIAGFQEKNLDAYRQITSVGANFAGSLSDLRIASTKTYMTLDQFSKVITNNAQTLSKMGSNVNEGTQAFVQLSNSLLSSKAGENLLALGYSTEEVNNGMLGFINATGGRSAQELKNTQAITQASADYMTELDKLTQFTGASRKQMEEEQKKAAQQAAWQRALSKMSEEQRAKAQTAYNAAAASGIAGATDLVMSEMAGLPPVTKEAKELAGTMPDAYNGIRDMTDAAKSNTSTLGDVEKGFGKFNEGISNNVKNLGVAGDYMSLTGNKLVNSAGLYANQLEKGGKDTAEGTAKAFKDISAQQKKQTESQAADMTKAQNQLKEFGQVLMSIVAPIAGFLTPALKFLGPALMGLVAIVVGVRTAMMAWQAAMAIRGAFASGGARGVGGLIAEKVTGGGGAAGSASAAVGSGGGAAGFGKGFVTFVKSLGRGLASLAPIAVPMLIGAGAVAGVIAILGVGIAAAIAVIGVGLPVFAKGLKTITEIDGLALAKIAGGLMLLGPAMAIFSASMIASSVGTIGAKIGNFFSGGGPVSLIKDSITQLSPVIPQLVQIGPALEAYGRGIVAFGRAVSTVDVAKAERLKDIMKGPGVLEGIGSAIKDVGAATAKLMVGQTGGQEKSNLELTTLNNNVKELTKIMKEVAEHTKKTVDATKALNGNVFA